MLRDSVKISLQTRKLLLSDSAPPAPGRVEITEGKITAITAPSPSPTFDLGDLVLMAGIVDSHAHINEPGRTEWEGFETATQAAAAGGITTVVDMPLNSIPPTTTVAALRRKADAARGKCMIDYGFWGGLVRENEKDLLPLVEAGVRGFKAFLIDSGVEEFAWAREPELRAGMRLLAGKGVPLLAHAELDLGAPLADESPRRYHHYLVSRPPRWEVEAIRLLIRLCRETKCPVHIVHLSAAEALPDIGAAKAEGLPFTVESCPHYLTFAAEEIPDGATVFKCAPPIRESRNREALWKGLTQGTIDMVVSDHSPCTPRLKGLEQGDFSKAWGGIAGLQFSLSVTWSGMKERGIELRHLTRWMARNPACLAGLSGIKGEIAVGKDADLVAWDPSATFQVEESTVRHRHHLTPYLLRELSGRVAKTWVRGELVYDEGEFPKLAVGKQL